MRGELTKEEFDKIICYRFSQVKNATKVGEEYGVSRMYVKRAWARQTKDERETLKQMREQIDEDLNQRIIDAERVAGDHFMQNIITSRELAGREILRRFADPLLRDMTDRDLASLVKLLHTITTEQPPQPEDNEKQDTFRLRREAIRADIERTLTTE